MDYKEQKIKEFGDLFDNNFLQWDLTDKLGMKVRAEAFFLKTLEELEREHGQQIAYLNNMLRKQEEEIETLKGHLDVSKIIEKKYSDCCNYEIYEKPNSWKEYCSSCNESCAQRKD